jgi:hypothetical protein
VRVKTWADMAKIYGTLYDGNHPYRTVILDSLTEVQKFSMAQIMRAVWEADNDRDPDIPSVREWGKNIEQTRRLIRGLRDLPINTIFTALAIEDKDEITGQRNMRPYLSGKLAGEVAGFLDIVVYMYKRQVGDDFERLILTQATDRVTAKDRTTRLPQVMQSPTMAQLDSAISKTSTTN